MAWLGEAKRHNLGEFAGIRRNRLTKNKKTFSQAGIEIDNLSRLLAVIGPIFSNFNHYKINL